MKNPDLYLIHIQEYLAKVQCLPEIPVLNPKGIPSQSPGLRAASYPGKSG